MSLDTGSTDTATSDADTEIVMTVTEQAMETVLGIRDQEDAPETLALRVEITGAKGVEFTYDLSFEEIGAAAEDDHRYQVGALTVLIPAASVERLRGAELDLPRTAAQGGLVIRNPNRPDPLAGVDLHLEGTIAEQVTQLLEQSINPSLDAHGGYATLVGVDEDNRVFLTMGGGCQGCAMSAMTLRDGIDRAIRDAIPEVTDIVDATEHAAGENPFYS